MLAAYVPAKTTPLSFDEAAGCMNAALAAEIGQTPATNVLALALAKTALETGRWSAIWCANWGNIKAGEQYTGLFSCISLNEVLAAGVTWFAPAGELNRKGGTVIGKVWDVPPGHPQTRMRAYSSPQEGATEYVSFVASGRYRDAWQELLAGNPAAYVHALKAARYFTADEAQYAKGVVSLHSEFVAKLQGRPAREMPVAPHEEIRAILAPQPWNQHEVMAMMDAAFVAREPQIIEENMRDAHREMAG